MAINVKAALAAFKVAGISLMADFHSLSMRQVAVVVEQAAANNYREPKNANGSRARCFFYAVKRIAQRTGEKHVRDIVQHGHKVAAAPASSQDEAIANADAHVSNAGMPTYSELRDHLAELTAGLRLAGYSDPMKEFAKHCDKLVKRAHPVEVES